MILLAHGGAGSRRRSRKAFEKLADALSSGYGILREGGTALDAVVEAISTLEESGIFNAGAGANLQLDGIRRLDASLMDGRDLRAGAVIGLEGIRNPIQAARIVLGLPHVVLTDVGARRIARAENLAPLPEPTEGERRKLERAVKKGTPVTRMYRKYFSTVGAVALDSHGDLASGASTGGIATMIPGRVGDTPVIGAGIYAENGSGAVSCTGTGENILRLALAKEICMRMKDMTPLAAARLSLKRILKIGGNAGVIALNRKGEFTLMHTTECMISGYIRAEGVRVREAFKRIRVHE